MIHANQSLNILQCHVGCILYVCSLTLCKFTMFSQLTILAWHWPLCDTTISVTWDSCFNAYSLAIYNISWCVECINAEAIPTKKAMLLQIVVAMKAMPWYVALPTFSEYMVENGWTRCFPSISSIGWIDYVWNLIGYLVFVEFGIYWMHRELHDIKPLYKYLHATHHIYNKQNTLSPFAGKFF